MSARTDRTRRRLFNATLGLIGDLGLDGLTVDDIAAEAGVAKGTVYYNFGSKDGLVDALLRYGVGLLAEQMRAGEDDDPGDALESTVDGALAFVDAYPSFAQLLVGELWRTRGRWHDTLGLLREEIVSILKERLAPLAAAGRLPAGVEVPTAAAALFGTVLVAALDWKVFQPQRARSEVRESIMALARALPT